MFSLLYIDDEPDYLEIVRQYLEETGDFSVDTARSGQEGLLLLDKKTYDAVISDYQMPGFDGISLLNEIRTRFAGIPFIFLTGKGREDVVIRALNAGADGYIQKGGDPDALFAELAHRARQLIEKRHAEEALRNSEELFRGMAERSSDVIITSDEHGRITYVSPSINVITGIGPGDLIGQSVKTLFPDKEIADQINRIMDRGLTAVSPHDIVIRMRKKDGSWAFLEARGTPIFRNGDFSGIQFQGRDITRRKQAEDELQQKNRELSAAFQQLAAGEEELRQNYDQLAAFQKTLEESEARFRALFTLFPEGILLVDRKSRVMFVSPEVLRMFRIESPDEIIGTSLLDWIEPECHAIAQDSLVQVLDGKIRHEITYRVRRKDGSSFWAETSQGILPDADGNADGIIVIIRDITDRQIAESVLRESEEKFRALVEYSLDGILILDPVGIMLFANQATEKLVETENIAGMFGKVNVMEFIAPESQADVLNDFSQVSRGIDGYIAQYKLCTTKGSEAWVESIGKRILFEGRSAILISLRDITERKRAEDVLRESENKFSTVFRRSPVALTIGQASDGKFVDVNDVFLRNTGYARNEVIGRTSDELGMFVDPEQRERMVTMLKEKKGIFGMELSFRVKSGNVRTCLFSSTLIVMGGRPHFLSTIEDINERKNAETAFQAMVRSMVGSTGLASLDLITQNVSAWLGADCVMIGEIIPDKQSVNVLSMILDGRPVPDFSYPLRGTPCDNVTEKGFCHYPDDVARLFPKSRDLAELNIRGYLGTPLRNSAGEVFGIICVLSRAPIPPNPSVREIIEVIAVKAAAEIERSHVELALRESQQMLTASMDLANLANWEYDVATDMFTFDDRFYSLYGTTAEREGGNHMSGEQYAREFVPAEDRYIVAEEGENAIRAADPHYVSQREHRIIRRDGEIRHIVVRIGITKDSEGRTIKTHGANQDITQRKRTEEVLRQVNKNLNLLSSITRHDVLNKISVIQGYISISKRRGADQDYPALLAKIQSATSVIKSHIEFTRLYQSLGTKEPAWQKPSDLIASVQLPGTVALQNELGDLEIYADLMLENVFYNLVDNSLRHGGSVTGIRLHSREGSDGLTVFFEDNGTGIPEDEKEQIFERGYGKNTGLGLFLVQEILGITGITITESGEPGKGARFEIHVPKGGYRNTSPE